MAGKIPRRRRGISSFPCLISAPQASAQNAVSMNLKNRATKLKNRATIFENHATIFENRAMNFKNRATIFEIRLDEVFLFSATPPPAEVAEKIPLRWRGGRRRRTGWVVPR